MFINTAPLEAVDVKQIQDRREVTITKDEFKVLKFEELHVAQYERYLKSLTELNAKLKLSNFEADQELFKEFKKCILQCVVRCFKSLWHYNHFKLLSDLMMKFVKYEECRVALY